MVLLLCCWAKNI